MTVIVDYDMGNVASIANMLKRIGVQNVVLSKKADDIARAQKLILPGVGAFDNGMVNLKKNDLIKPLTQRVLEDGIPVLGICLGMQLFTRSSEEGKNAGLGWLNARTVRFPFSTTSDVKVPHMGWNYVEPKKEESILASEDRSRFYFVHSYYVECERSEDILATAHYGIEFACAVHRDNIMGVQFHPEKSHRFGMSLFEKFAAL